MIIACPECSGPFEIEDDRIAALVQIECPHCSFRMILDFAAANDPSLVEEGMQMASGYRSAVDYRSSLQAPAEPTLRPAPPPSVEEVITKPEPALRPVPTQEQPAPRPPLEAIRTEAPARHVEPPRPAAEAPRAQTQVPIHAPPHEVRRATVSPQHEAPVPTRGDTQVGRAPTAPPAYDYDDDAPTRVHDVESISAQAADLPARGDRTVVAGSPTRAYGSEARRPAAQWTPPAAPVHDYGQHAPPEEVETRPEAELPPPPMPRSAAVELPRAAAAADSYADDLDGSGDLDDYPVRRSAAGTVVVTLLLLAALGLVGASIAIKQTPDPRPLLQDLIRGNM